MSKALEKLLKQRDRINAQIQKKKAMEAAAERKRDTRRKILLGALMMEMMERGELDKKAIDKRLDGFLVREGDRLLFHLPVKEADGKGQGTKKKNTGTDGTGKTGGK